ncbi:MAG: response regulator transcription factor [Caldilinea sp.]|nr:response regulator transcription factor [Caldilineaceae bacterium]MCB9116729.1 response regulator transcription factor [Caldilineaceae bacterium]MCB9122760.1 response regulator transcription factor [Caldilineaceae bacterium]MCO5210222.1 response regulator transcription factor [Caldilinea sp.]MCW5840628.1 response regulator transcription factor [Caldilinea sp.]
MSNETVLIVDDDKEIVRLLRGYLEQAGFAVRVAYDGTTALDVLRRERPALLLLDLMLPEMDGWEITRRVRQESAIAATPIIMLTARIEDTDKILGLELGADDYVTKPFNPREVQARVRACLRRQQRGETAPPATLQVGALRLDPTRYEVTLDGAALDLTRTEYNLLHLFMQNPGYVFTRSELIENALGYSYEGMDRTLDSHVKNLRRKIGDSPKEPAYIHTVYGIGYRMEAPL